MGAYLGENKITFYRLAMPRLQRCPSMSSLWTRVFCLLYVYVVCDREYLTSNRIILIESTTGNQIVEVETKALEMKKIIKFHF